MRKVCSVILLCAFLVVCGFALATSSVPERNQESEQRIASMELNLSAGNMTGEDYIIALMYAYIDDSLTLFETHKRGDSFERLQEEASSKYKEYRDIYFDTRLTNKVDNIMFYAAECISGDCSFAGQSRPVMPARGWLDLLVYEAFHNDTELYIAYPHTGSSIGIIEDLNDARLAYQTRIDEEAELKAKKEKKEADRLRKQQENEARQAALDAHYKALFENTTKELQKLENASNNITDNASKEAKLLDALWLLNNSSAYLVSPYSNMLSMSAGNILIEMSRLSDDHHKNLMTIALAGERYKNALTNFTYSNESEDYQNAIHQDFVNKYDGIFKVKYGIAEEKFIDELHAMMADLRDAPNAKQLLSGHINKKYETLVVNYTEPMLINISKGLSSKGLRWPFEMHLGYWVQVNLSAYDDPESSNKVEYMTQAIPTCIDIFASLFKDERISMVVVQLNGTYYDKFGHTEEKPVMMARLDNETAKEIGDWTTFKKYIGEDWDRFEQVVEVA